MNENSTELEAKRVEQIPKLAKLIQREEKKLAEKAAEVERITGERKVVLQARTDQEKKIQELKTDLVKLASGGFPERLFPHASSEIPDEDGEGDEAARKKKVASKEAEGEPKSRTKSLPGDKPLPLMPEDQAKQDEAKRRERANRPATNIGGPQLAV